MSSVRLLLLLSLLASPLLPQEIISELSMGTAPSPARMREWMALSEPTESARQKLEKERRSFRAALTSGDSARRDQAVSAAILLGHLNRDLSQRIIDAECVEALMRHIDDGGLTPAIPLMLRLYNAPAQPKLIQIALRQLAGGSIQLQNEIVLLLGYWSRSNAIARSSLIAILSGSEGERIGMFAISVLPDPNLPQSFVAEALGRVRARENAGGVHEALRAFSFATSVPMEVKAELKTLLSLAHHVDRGVLERLKILLGE